MCFASTFARSARTAASNVAFAPWRSTVGSAPPPLVAVRMPSRLPARDAWAGDPPATTSASATSAPARCSASRRPPSRPGRAASRRLERLLGAPQTQVVAEPERARGDASREPRRGLPPRASPGAPRSARRRVRRRHARRERRARARARRDRARRRARRATIRSTVMRASTGAARRGAGTRRARVRGRSPARRRGDRRSRRSALRSDGAPPG